MTAGFDARPPLERAGRETPEWTPFCEAMQAAYEAWQSTDGGDQFILTMERAMEAWRAYREARFGVAL